MQRGCKSEHSVAEKVVNISSGPQGSEPELHKRVPAQMILVKLCVLVFVQKF